MSPHISADTISRCLRRHIADGASPRKCAAATAASSPRRRCRGIFPAVSQAACPCRDVPRHRLSGDDAAVRLRGEDAAAHLRGENAAVQISGGMFPTAATSPRRRCRRTSPRRRCRGMSPRRCTDGDIPLEMYRGIFLAAYLRRHIRRGPRRRCRRTSPRRRCRNISGGISPVVHLCGDAPRHRLRVEDAAAHLPVHLRADSHASEQVRSRARTHQSM